MSDALIKYITAVSAALFVVVAGSGIAMFFGVGEHLVKEMHEWLAVVFAIAVGLHLVRNWKGMVTYFRKRTIAVPAALVAVAAVAFIVPAALNGHEGPMPALFQSLEQAKLDDLARVLNGGGGGGADDELHNALLRRGGDDGAALAGVGLGGR